MSIYFKFWKPKNYFKPELGYELCRPYFDLAIGDFELSVSFRARRKWSEFINTHNGYERHIVWGCISLSYGTPGLEPIRACANCGDVVNTIGAGDELWDYCSGCQQIEPETKEVLLKDMEY